MAVAVLVAAGRVLPSWAEVGHDTCGARVRGREAEPALLGHLRHAPKLGTQCWASSRRGPKEGALCRRGSGDASPRAEAQAGRSRSRAEIEAEPKLKLQ